MAEPARGSTTRLVRYEAMRVAIEEAHSVDEAKDIRRKAVALEMYARQANNRELERWVREIRVRAERRTGELLRVLPKASGARGMAGPGRGNKTASSKMSPFQDHPLIKNLGITHNQSSEWQKLANVPKEDFEAELANPVALPTAAHIIAAHEAKTAPPAPETPPVDPKALWLWGRLKDFQREAILAADPEALLDSMTDHMRITTLELAPKVAAWLARIKP